MAESNDNKYQIDFLNKGQTDLTMFPNTLNTQEFFFLTERGKLRIVSNLRFREHCKLSAVIAEKSLTGLQLQSLDWSEGYSIRVRGTSPA